MNWEPDHCVLEHIRTSYSLEVASLQPYSDLEVVRSIASLIYYTAEVEFHSLNPWFTPSRLFVGDFVHNIIGWKDAQEIVFQEWSAIGPEFSAFIQNPDTERLQCIGDKSRQAIQSCNLPEIPSITSALLTPAD